MTEPLCIAALSVQDHVVVVSSETEVENKPADEKDVDPTALATLLSTETAVGLMMTAEGVLVEGVLTAKELTIEDHLHAQGVVVSQPGCELAVIVGDVTVCFALDDDDVVVPPAGTSVRVEAETRYNSSTGEFSFTAANVERLD